MYIYIEREIFNKKINDIENKTIRFNQYMY